MKNVFKVLGIIALVAVIGFSMVSCKSDDDDGGGGNSSNWVGTWKMTESSNGNIPTTVPYFTLNADKSWTVGNSINTYSGNNWSDGPHVGFLNKPGIVLPLDEGGAYELYYEIISSTEAKITGSTVIPQGTYTKQ
jgi:hypothetical protein